MVYLTFWVTSASPFLLIPRCPTCSNSFFFNFHSLCIKVLSNFLLRQNCNRNSCHIYQCLSCREYCYANSPVLCTSTQKNFCYVKAFNRELDFIFRNLTNLDFYLACIPFSFISILPFKLESTDPTNSSNWPWELTILYLLNGWIYIFKSLRCHFILYFQIKCYCNHTNFEVVLERVFQEAFIIVDDSSKILFQV